MIFLACPETKQRQVILLPRSERVQQLILHNHRTLEELDYGDPPSRCLALFPLLICSSYSVFAVPVSKHASYQVQKSVPPPLPLFSRQADLPLSLLRSIPYFFKRHVFRNKDAVLEDLYDFEEVEGSTKHGRRGEADAVDTKQDV
jgi:hypothetical protein